MDLIEGSADQKDRGMGMNGFWVWGLVVLVVILCFAVGLIVFGSGKFGWTVVALLLSYLVYRLRLP